MSAIKCFRCGQRHDVNKHHTTTTRVDPVADVPHLRVWRDGVINNAVDGLIQVAAENGYQATREEALTHIGLLAQKVRRKDFDEADRKKRKKQRNKRKQSRRKNRQPKKK